MNWIMLPVLLVYVALVVILQQKLKNVILQAIVRSKILKIMGGRSTIIAIETYNIVFAFVLIPIFFVGLAIFFNDIPYRYNWYISIAAYVSSFLSL